MNLPRNRHPGSWTVKAWRQPVDLHDARIPSGHADAVKSDFETGSSHFIASGRARG